MKTRNLILYMFCRKMEFDFGKVLTLAQKVSAMTTNPTPQYICENEFKKAKQTALEILTMEL